MVTNFEKNAKWFKKARTYLSHTGQPTTTLEFYGSCESTAYAGGSGCTGASLHTVGSP